MNKVVQLVLKVFAGVLTTVGIVTLSVKIVVAFQESASDRKQILEKVVTVEQKVDGLTTDVDFLRREQFETRKELTSLASDNTNLKNYMVSSAASKGDVKELMEIIRIWDGEKKNSGNVSLEIALPPLKPETQLNYK